MKQWYALYVLLCSYPLCSPCAYVRSKGRHTVTIHRGLSKIADTLQMTFQNCLNINDPDVWRRDSERDRQRQTDKNRDRRIETDGGWGAEINRERGGWMGGWMDRWIDGWM